MLEIEAALLAADAQARDQSLVAFRAAATQIIEQTAAPRDHLKEAPTGVVILRVGFEVRHQLIDALAQDCNLDLWRAGVRFVDPELRNCFGLYFTRQCHS